MKFATLVLSYGGCGRLPIAPGTWGTLGAMVTAAALLPVDGVREHWIEVCLAWVLGATALCVLLTPEVEAGEGKKDPGVIVMDEVAGYWATLLPFENPGLPELVAAFFVFRLFDIVKPWPGRSLEKLPSGWGVALDDVMAGIYGAAIFWGVGVWAAAA